MVATADAGYDGSNDAHYDHATAKNGRLVFHAVATPRSSATWSQFRLKVTTYSAAVIGHGVAPAIDLSSQGPIGTANFTTPCWSD